MKIIEPSAEILTPIAGEAGRDKLRLIELAARTCYKTEDCITNDSHQEFVKKIANVFKHESVIEHAVVTVRFIVDRGVSHELVRHRIGAFSQESTRYCNYGKGKFGKSITVIRPPWVNFPGSGLPHDDLSEAWLEACHEAEDAYFKLLAGGWSPQQARSVLPNSLKTEVIATFNLRQWRHVFRMRCSTKAHPQMQQVMIPLAAQFAEHLPELFAGIQTQET